MGTMTPARARILAVAALHLQARQYHFGAACYDAGSRATFAVRGWKKRDQLLQAIQILEQPEQLSLFTNDTMEMEGG